MKELNTSVTIIGSGSAGISAAMTLLEKKIPFVMLEKGDKLGGAGRFGAHGVFAIDSKQQKAQGIKYDYKTAFEDMTKYNHYFVNGELLSHFLHVSGEMISWLDSIGLPTVLEASEQKLHADDPKVYHKFDSMDGKFAAWDEMAQKIEAGGNKILRETAAQDLDYSDNHLNAVLAETKDGEDIRINCQYVVIGDGGYPGNPEMMREKYSDADNLLNLGERKATGVGIQMAKKLGADTEHTPVLFAHACSPSAQINPMKRDSSVETLTNLPLFWVAQDGKRFVNEYIVYDFALWANAAHNVGGKYFVLLDQKTLDHFKNEKVEWEDTFERQFTDPGEVAKTSVGPLPNIQSDFDEAIETGEVTKADSIEGLAGKLNIPLSNLQVTIKKYNQAVDQQRDDIFVKDPEFLKFGLDDNGPYYAIEEHVAILGTQDGVNVNSDCEPVRADGTAIEGLYVVGNNANGLYSDSYPIFEGVANGFAFASGRISGLEIADKLTK